ncbi:MAG: hypothetical protein HYV07_18370 [Deltaproteobacteria bacterium]|nr:hypothetical protein [Deltaproteobacteria bacterium]
MSVPLLLICFVDTSTGAAAFLRAVVEGRAGLPSLDVVQSAAEKRLGVGDSGTFESAASRARARGWIPRLDLALGSDAGLDVRDSSASTARTTTDKRGFGVELGVHFDLGQLVFSPAEVQSARVAISRSAAISLSRERVTELYFRRVEVLLETRDLEERRARGQPVFDSRLRELAVEAATLDGRIRALTGPLPKPSKGTKR